MKSVCILMLLVFCIADAPAARQSPSVKFGKVDSDDLEMKSYQPDPEAKAVVLFDKGISSFTYNQATGFNIQFERHKRIKILSKDGYSWANMEISLYKSGGEKEVIQKLNGFTFNLVDGDIVKTKLEKNSSFQEELNDHWNVTKIAFPEVTEGSVIDVQYVISSPFTSQLRSWNFQDRIPVVWSEYITKIPEYFNYLKFTQGYEPFVITDEFQEASSITLHYNERSGERAVQSRATVQTVNLSNHVTHLAAANVPAFNDESFISRPEDYFLNIEYQLASIKWPNKVPEQILSDWHEVENRLLEHSNFGLEIKKRSLYRSLSETLGSQASTELEKAVAARQYILENVAWDGKNRMLASDNNDLLKTKSGSSADINLFYTGLLKEMGVEAYPVIISTRNNGKVHPIHPLISKYNYTIVQVVADGKTYLTDLTDPFIPFGYLPERCLNERGRRIDKDNPGWVTINAPSISTQSYTVKMSLSDKGAISGTANRKVEGYYALETKKSFRSEGEDQYKNKLASKIESWTVSDVEIIDEVDEVSFRESFKMELGSSANGADIIYLEPVPFLKVTENPFRQEARNYPIDYRFPTRNILMASIEIPDTYKVEELPQAKTFALPDKGGLFTYNVSMSGHTISIYSRFDLTKSLYLPDEYLYLKAAYDEILNTHSQQIVLRKL